MCSERPWAPARPTTAFARPSPRALPVRRLNRCRPGSPDSKTHHRPTRLRKTRRSPKRGAALPASSARSPRPVRTRLPRPPRRGTPGRPPPGKARPCRAPTRDADQRGRLLRTRALASRSTRTARPRLPGPSSGTRWSPPDFRTTRRPPASPPRCCPPRCRTRPRVPPRRRSRRWRGVRPATSGAPWGRRARSGLRGPRSCAPPRRRTSLPRARPRPRAVR